jgi:putative ABC transport system substrate-binding protein
MHVRRRLLLGFGAWLLGAPAAGLSQASSFRVGILSSLAASSRDDAFVDALRLLGYVEGKNLHLSRQYPGGNTSKLEQSAKALVEQQVQVIFAPTTIAAVVAKRSASVPVVFATAPDPVGSGLVASLARPGGLATGTTSVSTELNAKRLQLLKEAFPHVSRVAVVRSPEPVVNVHLAEIEGAAKSLGLSLLVMEMRNAAQAGEVREQLQQWRADCLYVIQSTTNFNNRQVLVDLAAASALPAVFPYRESVEAGGLMSYGTDFDALYRRSALYVHKILRGGKPQELAVEQPTTFELIINRAVANKLRVRISAAVLARADRVID